MCASSCGGRGTSPDGDHGSGRHGGRVGPEEGRVVDGRGGVERAEVCLDGRAEVGVREAVDDGVVDDRGLGKERRERGRPRRHQRRVAKLPDQAEDRVRCPRHQEQHHQPKNYFGGFERAEKRTRKKN
jgi:hypothetical protein